MKSRFPAFPPSSVIIVNASMKTPTAKMAAAASFRLTLLGREDILLMIARSRAPYLLSFWFMATFSVQESALCTARHSKFELYTAVDRRGVYTFGSDWINSRSAEFHVVR